MHIVHRKLSFAASHLYLPMLAFGVAALTLESSSLDIWFADLLYQWSGGAWNFRDAWLTAALIHKGGRSLVGLMIVLVLLTLTASNFVARLEHYRTALIYLLASALISGVVINLLKSLSHVDCPWDLLRYGGIHPYIRNFAHLPAGLEVSGCFPSGHASAAYAWFGLYYVCRVHKPAWSRFMLAGVLVMGLVFGFGQQLRGAHFLSHDLWTLGVCWLLATLLFRLFFPHLFSLQFKQFILHPALYKAIKS